MVINNISYFSVQKSWMFYLILNVIYNFYQIKRDITIATTVATTLRFILNS